MTFREVLSLLIIGVALLLALWFYRDRLYAYLAGSSTGLLVLRYVVWPTLYARATVAGWFYEWWPRVRTVLATFGLAVCVTGALVRCLMVPFG